MIFFFSQAAFIFRYFAKNMHFIIILFPQIHGYFYVTGNGSSVCGVSIRVGGHVVRINKCETRGESIHPVTVRLFRNGDNSNPLFKVLKEDNGATYKVNDMNYYNFSLTK